MSALSGVGAEYNLTQPIANQLKVTIAKAKLHAIEAADAAKLSALDHVVEELHLGVSEQTGALLDIDV